MSYRPMVPKLCITSTFKGHRGLRLLINENFFLNNSLLMSIFLSCLHKQITVLIFGPKKGITENKVWEPLI